MPPFGPTMYWKSAATLSIALAAFTGSAAAQCGQAANSNLISYLGSAGPANFTVLSLGGNGALVNINLASIAGNVGVPNFGTVKESAPSSVSGNLIVGSSVNTARVDSPRSAMRPHGAHSESMRNNFGMPCSRRLMRVSAATGNFLTFGR